MFVVFFSRSKHWRHFCSTVLSILGLVPSFSSHLFAFELPNYHQLLALVWWHINHLNYCYFLQPLAGVLNVQIPTLSNIRMIFEPVSIPFACLPWSISSIGETGLDTTDRFYYCFLQSWLAFPNVQITISVKGWHDPHISQHFICLPSLFNFFS